MSSNPLLTDRVLARLKDIVASHATLCDDLGVTAERLDWALARLRLEKRVVCVEGTYRLRSALVRNPVVDFWGPDPARVARGRMGGGRKHRAYRADPTTILE